MIYLGRLPVVKKHIANMKRILVPHINFDPTTHTPFSAPIADTAETPTRWFDLSHSPQLSPS